MKIRHVVVIGGSLSGCLMARVWSEFAEQVTIVERDAHPLTSGPRPGVPQAHHVHLLLVRGRQILEKFFPGFVTDLESRGAVDADLSADLRCQQYGQWRGRFETGIRAHYCSRALIDEVIREHALRLPNVRVCFGMEVTGVEMREGGVVSAVLLADSNGYHRLSSDFVIDASGRGSKMSEWLAGHGFAEPGIEVVPSRLGYASRVYRRNAELAKLWRVLLILPDPPEVRRMGCREPDRGRSLDRNPRRLLWRQPAR